MDWSIDIGFQKMARYCAYQDRSRLELVRKLRELECPEEKHDDVLDELAAQGFWDEERFARAYVRGKFRNNHWGKMKIRQGLRAKGVEDRLTELALKEEITPEAYRETLRKALEKKTGGDYAGIGLVERQKVFRSLAAKGFEGSLVAEVWEDEKENPQ